MCGIVGIVAQQPVNQELYDALTVLQHRGQDSAGIATYKQGRIHLHKNNGLVRDVFNEADMIGLPGNMGIGHVRYPTAGSSSKNEAQPFYVNSPFGLSLSHNGNLTNTEELKRSLFIEDRRHINTDSDSEVLLNVFAHELQSINKLRITAGDVFKVVSRVHQRCRGAYAVTILISGVGIVGFRDPHAIRPMVFGERRTKNGLDYMMASESVALDVLGFNVLRDIDPGEAVFITKSGKVYSQQCAKKPKNNPCIFEYVYLARPDSIINGISVYNARLRIGENLAHKIMNSGKFNDIDVIIPIPETSRTLAIQMSGILQVPVREGFVKNHYIGRTFIMPGQQMRKKSVRQKLNLIKTEFKDKNVLLVDDSIVRGTTSAQIIQLARDAGAKNVYFASAAPPVRYPNVYGIDLPASSELIASGREEQEICQILGADNIIYQDLEDLVNAVGYGTNITEFDTSCFSNIYVTGDIDSSYLQQTQSLRSDSVKK